MFQAIAIDVWDGSPALVEIFIANAEITYPMLMLGSQNGIQSDYGVGYDYTFIIGGDGKVLYRGPGYNQTFIRTVIDQGIEDLATAAAPDTPAVEHQLLDNYPNPFNPQTRIPFDLAGDSGSLSVRLAILDVRGRLVRTLIDGTRAAGQRHEAVWSGLDDAGRPAPSGTYFSQLTVDGVPQSRLMTLVK